MNYPQQLTTPSSCWACWPLPSSCVWFCSSCWDVGDSTTEYERLSNTQILWTNSAVSVLCAFVLCFRHGLKNGHVKCPKEHISQVVCPTQTAPYLFSSTEWFFVNFPLFFFIPKPPHPSTQTFTNRPAISCVLLPLPHHLPLTQQLNNMNPSKTLCLHLPYPGTSFSAEQLLIILLITQSKWKCIEKNIVSVSFFNDV